MSVVSKVSPNNTKDSQKEILVCPNAPKITIRPVQKPIPYINVIEDIDSSDQEEEEEKEKSISKIKEYKKEADDRYNDSDDSFDEDFYDERETKSQSGNVKEGLKKFIEANPQSAS